MKIKLLHIPRYDVNPFLKGMEDLLGGFIPEKIILTHFLPPLGIAILTAFLRKSGISVDQDDLFIKAFYHNLSTTNPDRQINLQIFNDEGRIENFIGTGHDPELEAEGKKILGLTNCRGFDVFGFSLYETTNPSPAGIALTLGKLLKEKYDSTIIIGGNMHHEVKEMLVKTKFIDCSTFGEGGEEAKLLNFCMMYERGIPMEKIPGFLFADKRGDLMHKPVPKGAQEKRVLSKPDFNGLPLDLYRPKISCSIDGTQYKYSILVLPYIFVNGCPYRCAFCNDSIGGWAAKKPEEVAIELKELSKECGTKYFLFINTNINPTYEYAEKVASALTRHDVDILWSDCATFCNMDEKLLRKLKGVGATRLIFGVESASRKILKYIQKPLPSISYIEKILREAYSLGIWNELDIICGFPYEGERDIDLTIRFIKKNRKYVQEYYVSKFRPSGRIGKNPEIYGIHIPKMNPAVQRQGQYIPFEEMDGLPWKKKAEQIDRYYRKIMLAIGPGFKTIRIPGMSSDGLIYIHLTNWWGSNPKIWDKKKKMFVSEELKNPSVEELLQRL